MHPDLIKRKVTLLSSRKWRPRGICTNGHHCLVTSLPLANLIQSPFVCLSHVHNLPLLVCDPNCFFGSSFPYEVYWSNKIYIKSVCFGLVGLSFVSGDWGLENRKKRILFSSTLGSTTITKDEWFRQQTLISHRSGVQKSKIEMLAGLFSPACRWLPSCYSLSWPFSVCMSPWWLQVWPNFFLYVHFFDWTKVLPFDLIWLLLPL